MTPTEQMVTPLREDRSTPSDNASIGQYTPERKMHAMAVLIKSTSSATDVTTPKTEGERQDNEGDNQLTQTENPTHEGSIAAEQS